MTPRLHITEFNPPTESWPAEVRKLRELLGAPENPHLFPPHYLGSTFPRAGGRVVLCRIRGELAGAGFLFPRDLKDGNREFTFRFHTAPGQSPIGAEEAADAAAALFPGDGLFSYDPCSAHRYGATSEEVDGVEVGRPGEEEAAAIRTVQRTIWGSEDDFLYPADVHSLEFRPGTSLVARAAGRPVGFLLGLYKSGGSRLPEGLHARFRTDFRIESQMIGVLPDFRGKGIALALKKIQAQDARRQGIDVIDWTADPLQYGNALLNFGRLSAVACDFRRDYYAFRNDLNRLPTSRLWISWFPGTERVREGIAAVSRSNVLAVGDGGHGVAEVVNRGPCEVNLETTSSAIAIEIPTHWSSLQREDLPLALSWREATDAILEHYIGISEGKYIITGVGEDGGRKYLIAEKTDAELLGRLAR